ncbi:MAG: hypothetical protein IPK20_16365 [Betaproteobacteria bacterium]|nr:hypothetical protein [Betaproteobacteria bacterium]
MTIIITALHSLFAQDNSETFEFKRSTAALEHDREAFRASYGNPAHKRHNQQRKMRRLTIRMPLEDFDGEPILCTRRHTLRLGSGTLSTGTSMIDILDPLGLSIHGHLTRTVKMFRWMKCLPPIVRRCRNSGASE